MTYLALLAARSGRKAGYIAVAGVALGLACVGIAAALGLTAVVTSSPTVYSMLRWGGVAYLLYLALDAWRDGRRQNDELFETSPNFFARGLITNLLNPKAVVFYVTVLPTFIEPSRSVLSQSLVLTSVYVLVATSVHATIVTLSGFLRPFLVDTAIRQVTGVVFAVSLVGVAGWVAWSTR